MLLGHSTDLARHEGSRRAWLLQRQRRDQPPQFRLDQAAPVAIGWQVAHQAGKSESAIAGHPTLRGPQRNGVMWGELSKRDAVFERRAQKLKPLEGELALGLGQETGVWLRHRERPPANSRRVVECGAVAAAGCALRITRCGPIVTRFRTRKERRNRHGSRRE